MKALRVAICIMLIVCVFAMSLSVMAVDSSPSPYPQLDGGVGDTLTEQYLYAMWVTLNAWGINVTLNETEEYSDEIGAWIYGQVLDFLNDIPSVSTWGQWVSPWFIAVNEWGIFEGNDSYVEDMQDFVDWLVAKLGLTDNTQTSITLYSYIPVIDKENEPIYLTVQIQDYGSVWLPKYENVQMSNILDEFNGFIKGDVYHLESGYYFRYLDYNSSTYVFQFSVDSEFNNIAYSFNQNSSYANNKYDSPYYDGYNYYWGNGQCFVFYNPNITNNHNSHYGLFTGAQYQRANQRMVLTGGESITDATFIQYFMPQSHGYDIETGVIELPSDDGWQNGQSIQIIDGEPIYIEINWPESIKVENLPAIVTQRNIPDIGNDEENPGFTVPWQAINGLIQYVAAPAGAIMALINEAPVEGVIMLYALIGGMIIFGMIRIMREH